MASVIFVTMLLVAATIGASVMQDMPEFLHICHTEESNFLTCVMDSIHSLRPHLKSGEPKYKIPTLEPLRLKELMPSPNSALRLQARDIDVYGASNFRLTKLKIDLERLIFILDIELANIVVEGQYQLDGKLLSLPIHGAGPLHGNFSNCKGACRIKAAKYMENNVEKVRIEEFRMKINVGSGTLYLDNLFNGEKTLSDVINTTINNNFDLVAKEILPLVEDGLAKALKEIANNIVGQFTYAQLFPK